MLVKPTYQTVFYCVFQEIPSHPKRMELKVHPLRPTYAKMDVILSGAVGVSVELQLIVDNEILSKTVIAAGSVDKRWTTIRSIGSNDLVKAHLVQNGCEGGSGVINLEVTCACY